MPFKNNKVHSANESAVMDENAKEKAKDRNEKKSEPTEAVSLLTLFRFSDRLDVLFMLLGTLCAGIAGCSMPGLIVIFGDVTDSFVGDAQLYGMMLRLQEYFPNQNFTNLYVPGSMLDKISRQSLYMALFGVGAWIFGCGQISFWGAAAERQVFKIRQAFFKSVIYKNMGWYDKNQSGALTTMLTDDTSKVQAGIGDKIALFINQLFMGVAFFLLGFIKGWKLSLVILSLFPALAIAAVIMSKVVAKMQETEGGAYAKAGAVAEEALSNIRAVTAYGGQKIEVERYAERLTEAVKSGVKKGAVSGAGLGFTWFVIFAAYCLGFWYGAQLVRADSDQCLHDCINAVNGTMSANWKSICSCEGMTYTAGTMLIVFISIVMAAMGFGTAFPNLAALAEARGSAKKIYDIIDEKLPLDASSTEGGKSMDFNDIHFRDLHFTYPTRKEAKVLQGLNLDIPIGKTTAIVGPSGCGKSTVVQLIQQFYQHESGSVSIGDSPIESLNLAWLRSQIGIVGQEPILFAGSILENIQLGREGSNKEDVITAAKSANAHDFIAQLPMGYDTVIGERGAQISGGQKQRIAIARALIRNPKILLLDEATSALDTESEGIVQAALDKASQGRTTIMIAHRLSTVRNADNIVVFKDGVLAESGTHQELIEQQGLYFEMVNIQALNKDENIIEHPTSPGRIIGSAVSRRSKRGGSAKSAGILNRLKSVESEENGTVANGDLEQAETKEKEGENKPPEVGFSRVMKMNTKEWPFMLIGILAAGVNGASQPVFGVVFGEMLGVFAITDLEKQKKEALIWSMMFLVIGFVMGFSMFLQTFMFAWSGEGLTKRLRTLTFDSVLRQEIGWFDDPRNTTGALTARLSSDASAVQGITGTRLGVMLQGVLAMGIGVILALIFGWQLTLVILAFVPFMIIGGILSTKIMTGYSVDAKEGLIENGKLASEIFSSIKTVAGLGLEQHFIVKFHNFLLPPHKQELKKSFVNGMAFGFSQGSIFFAEAAGFYFGALFVDKGYMDFADVMIVFSCILFSAMSVGQMSSFAPDYAKAKAAANEIFALLDRASKIDPADTTGQKLEHVEGKLSFKNVRFRYPTREEVEVVQGLSLELDPGSTVALVGSSGCGKSTCIQMIERFYDPFEGELILEDTVITSLNIQWLRAQIGLVSQEPLLFDRSIRENIAYGDNSRTVPMDQIIEAAKSANAHDFIVSLPAGYETEVGEKGGQLSGGQKQRIAIARALIRHPKILLLDEATSALDSESEKVVQAALDKASKDRTCLVIAHRLSTIQGADKIVVLDKGRIEEQGTHQELLSHKALYHKLYTSQNLSS